MLRLSLLAGIAAIIIPSSVYAQQAAPPQRVNDATAAGTASYWTSQRMTNAKPMPMPPHNGAATSPSASTPRTESHPLTGTEQSGKSSPPTIPDSQIPPGIQKQSAETKQHMLDLGDGAQSTSVPTANSGYGYPFTTSEVQPVAAQTSYPFRASGRLYFTEQGVGDFICSASMVRPGIMVTAGHCVAAPASGSKAAHYYSNWMYVPAYSNGNAPYGTWYPTWVDTTGEWFYGDGSVPNAQDVGMLAIGDQNGTRLGDITGWYGWMTNSLGGQQLTMLGYPCNLSNCRTMIRTDAGNSTSGGNNTYIYGSAGSGGYSGGAWVIDFGTDPTPTGVKTWSLGTNVLVGVTSYGPADEAGGYLGASQFDDSFVTLLNTLCSLQADACT